MFEYRAVIIAIAVILLCLAPVTTAATLQPARICHYGEGTGRCAEAWQQRMRELYGVSSIEEHQAAGDQVRRIFYVDGYGSDLLLIAFVRAPGRDPIVRVHFPRREGKDVPEPLHVAVPHAVWQDVLSSSAHFDRDLVPLSAGLENPSICLHGWTYTVEATDPARSRDQPATLRRTAENACDHGLAMIYAIEVERAALPLFPHCARLASNQHRNPATQLAACRILRGDRMVAADVRNLAEAFRTISGPGDAPRLTGVLTDLSVIDWNGERNQGHGSAAPFWAARGAPRIGVTTFHIELVEGESLTRIRLIGTLSRTTDTPRGRATGMETARVEQIWTGEGGFLRVERATVGAWEPFPPPRRATETRDRRRR